MKEKVLLKSGFIPTVTISKDQINKASKDVEDITNKLQYAPSKLKETLYECSF